MSYLVLARKYRPRRFAEVVGQEIVTRTLQGAIGEQRVGHAYLFSGPRGTGKTTTARIFAKALNCERGPGPEPCNECERCLAADAGAEADLIEIDAASHTGVDNVRALRDQASYAPLRARHKIYLIDEVHMLSRGAFNALLKTLEEPPPHVKFLFATTEPQKLPDTILSRCQVLKLSILPEELIVERLDEVFQREEVEAEAGISEGIARRSRGGMRDALSLADQLLALVGTSPRLEDLDRLSAGIDRAGVARLARSLADGDRPALLEALATFEGGEVEVLAALLAYLRDCLLAAHCGEASPLFDATAEERPEMASLARDLGAERLELILRELLLSRDSMRLLPGEARLILEVSLLELARPESSLPLDALAERLNALEARLASGEGAPVPAPVERSVPTRAAGSAAPPARGSESTRDSQPPRDAPPAKRRSTSAYQGAVRSSTAEAWSRFLDELEGRAQGLAEVLGRCGKLVELGGGRAVVRLTQLRDSDRALATDARNQRLGSKVFSDVMGEPVELRLEDGSAVRSGNQDPFTSKVAGLFEGRVEDES